MSSALTPALVAVFAGCAFAVVAFVPFVALSYRRRGEMTFWRSILWFAALIYAMALWAYTLLPFPEGRDVTCVPLQTVPFMFVNDVARFGVGSVGALVQNPAAVQVALNVVLFMPLGWFLRRLGGRGIVVATVSGFVVSMLIEVTQVTGIWGLYSCAYRVFDVDDLIANTAGALIGSIIGMLLWRRSRQNPDAGAPRPITAMRRLLGMLCDVALFWIASWIVVAISLVIALLDGRPQLGIPPAVFDTAAFVLPFTVQLLSVLIGGVTLGERIVLIRAVHRVTPAAIARPLRFVLGIGGYMLLVTWEAGLGSLLLGLLVVVSFIMAFTTRGHRGLAHAAATMDVVDARAEPLHGHAASDRRAGAR
ncbi:VanZ family protein [Paramicrobacterium chengjingii]|uniref:VanZ family protein n=1 Tax=Paramicrobacterium chengjingii TaxID=2769067 RepID=A0ABX6YGN9_9MICO|nr:VanZ family protein [Microbacterium chengjingii]QPZ37926.1 VanZ family protein [Microbacterium chengjingii]